MIIITTTLAKKDGTILQVVFLHFPPTTRYSLLHFIPPFSEKKANSSISKKLFYSKTKRTKSFASIHKMLKLTYSETQLQTQFGEVKNETNNAACLNIPRYFPTLP